jgi:hypothetical protein
MRLVIHLPGNAPGHRVTVRRACCGGSGKTRNCTGSRSDQHQEFIVSGEFGKLKNSVSNHNHTNHARVALQHSNPAPWSQCGGGRTIVIQRFLNL